jgi:hypothetical protein
MVSFGFNRMQDYSAAKQKASAECMACLFAVINCVMLLFKSKRTIGDGSFAEVF